MSRLLGDYFGFVALELVKDSILPYVPSRVLTEVRFKYSCGFTINESYVKLDGKRKSKQFSKCHPTSHIAEFNTGAQLLVGSVGLAEVICGSWTQTGRCKMDGDDPPKMLNEFTERYRYRKDMDDKKRLTIMPSKIQTLLRSKLLIVDCRAAKPKK